ncbi:hypothetical protein BCV70DRAFT_201071 [Testicularia cyperi]|uniref:Uncharacterized protein n=1 Tax=Testicularia cyperi TaxID=1882483 RepID=A0A317XMG6_9BASI|nr:hypothetical protein BCV70DRAFT_201071 [Testicularia cyperi]
MILRPFSTATATAAVVLVLGLVLLTPGGVDAKGGQEVGEMCNYKKNCYSWNGGAGDPWANGRVTCAVPQNMSPEGCGSSEDKRGDFSGICKMVGNLDPLDYGCECGVHKGDCPEMSPFRRIFWPTTWIKDAMNAKNG